MRTSSTSSFFALLAFAASMILMVAGQELDNRPIMTVSSLRSGLPFRSERPIPMTMRMAQARRYIPLLKKSDAKWEDLGWAWGKRSAQAPLMGLEPAAEVGERSIRSLKQVKKNPDWHDLGWAWGRK